MDIGMTLLGQMISFAILIWFTAKFIWPPLMAAIEERQAKIAAGLAAADRSKKDLAQAEEKVAEVLREARAKANEIIAQAEARKAQLIDAAKDEAVAEGNRLKALADAEIEQSAAKAREDLRKQVSSLAVIGAEKLIRREIDGNAHKALLDELAAEI
jgi:F-type H+-transporting ATPase subunit b